MSNIKQLEELENNVINLPECKISKYNFFEDDNFGSFVDNILSNSISINLKKPCYECCNRLSKGKHTLFCNKRKYLKYLYN